MQREWRYDWRNRNGGGFCFGSPIYQDEYILKIFIIVNTPASRAQHGSTADISLYN